MYKRIKIESSISNISKVESAIDEITSVIGIAKEDYGKILVSALEAVNNAIMHGNNYMKEKYVDVEISYKNDRLRIKVKDEGEGFIPGEIPDPTKPENIESVNGRGIFLMNKLADEVRYSRKGNTVIMIFKNIQH